MKMVNGEMCLTADEAEALSFACAQDGKRKAYYAKIPIRIIEAEPPDKDVLERVLAYAKIGLAAVIDEATGRQAERGPHDLQNELEAHLNGNPT